MAQSMIILNVLQVGVVNFKRLEGSEWELGVRVTNECEKDKDHVIDAEGYLIGDLWDIKDSSEQGSFQVLNMKLID